MPIMTREYIRQRMEEKGIPVEMQGGLERYLFDRISPGHFLTAVLENNLREAFSRGDLENTRVLRNYVLFLYNDVPANCWGSRERVTEWLGRKERS